MAAVASPFRTPDLISPNARRRRAIVLASTNTPTNHLAENDDAAERRQRRLSKATSVTLQSPATPRSASRLDSERSQTAGSNGLTNVQLKDLYSNCIKLSTENKINAKNAFGLHLIDYMQDLIKTVKEGDMTNFQVASCTLDASAKIYAGRVDSIHAQAYKMLGGLGRAENQDGDENGREGTGEEQQGPQKPKKSNHRPGNTIETNLKNLNVNQFDLAFEVDPLFHKTSAAFDEGGTGGLLLNHLFVRDDSCELLLDSTTVTMTTRDSSSEGQTTQDNSMVDLSELRDVYSRVNFDALQICPHFTDFEFTNWTRNGEANADYGKMVAEMDKNEHAFDVNAPATEPEPECEFPETMGDDYSDDDMPDMGGDMEFGRDGCENVFRNPICNASLAFADGQEARLVTSEDGRTTLASAATTAGTLCLELSSQPSDYSYFKSDLMATWAGPQHWKLRAKLSKGLTNSMSTAEQQNKKKRAKKQPFTIKFDSEVDFGSSFSKGRAATTLSKLTLAKYTADKTTLPEDLHYDADKLFRLFIKPKIMVKRQVQAQTELRDDGSAWYNYDNANDCANYCPDLQDGDDDDDVFDAADGAHDLPGREAEFPLSQDITSQDMTFGDSSQGLSFTNESVIDQALFAGDGLVAQPNKVQKIDIGYAKTAKKMDVKKLKGTMWRLLTDSGEGNKENITVDQQGKQTDGSNVNYPHSFKDIYARLPGKLSKNMSKNLSVSIAFVCILHLANEKCLKMTNEPGMGDFSISQGI
ncbi:hypothetical protein OS493_025460 [Desmophyllum pertusum]|uniref:Condensin complex subunit 2 n=1 Tax=Desmophyllum pertusum TaxID=174260 RepID=A0A9W9YLH3_9CNID|nr:hypothetical protein OS493_025460 [Desmophyllum pertusum]